jgi:CBS domain-containing protein
MDCKSAIAFEIPTLTGTDSGVYALDQMASFKVEHLPLVDAGIYKGLVAESAILDCDDLAAPLSQIATPLPTFSVLAHQHVFTAFDWFKNQPITLLPVVDTENHYVGSLTTAMLVQAAASMGVVREAGSILVLELGPQDYMLSEIARIVESHDSKILSSYLTQPADTNRLEVTLKINRMDLAPIIQTFERFEYKVLAAFQEPSANDELEDRYQQLMHFLNIGS